MAVSQAWRFCELVALFVAIPGVIHLSERAHFAGALTLGVMAAVAMGYCWLGRVPAGALGMGAGSRKAFLPAVVTGVAVIAVGAAVVYVYQVAVGRAFFQAVPFGAAYWVMLPLALAVLSLAQEFVFRAFFFFRYGDLLPRGTIVLVNAAVFGWVHLIHQRWEAAVMAFVGGVVLAGVYERHRSLAGVAVVSLIGGVLMVLTGFGRPFFRVW